MTLTVTCKRQASEERGSSDSNQQRNYQVSYQIEQTDTGSLASAPALITAAQSAGSTPLPIYGDEWSYDGSTDLDSYAQTFSWHRPNPGDRPKLLTVEVGFAPVNGGSGGGATHGRLVEPDPLLWEPTYHVEWTEESVPLVEAYNVNALTAINRDAMTLGKIVNACGVEFTEPLMKTIFYPVLQCTKAYETQEEILALNMTYQNTTNNGTFFGATKRSAKYLGTETGQKQKVNGVEFYMGITRIWFKKTKTVEGVVTKGWDRPVLNNGWTHFEILDDAFRTDGSGNKKRFKNTVHDDPDGDEDAEPTAGCSEPLNLSLIGTVLPGETEPFFIDYRDLEEVDYSGIGIGG